MSFDLGPRLALWLEQAHPDVYQRILQSERLSQALLRDVSKYQRKEGN